MSSEPTETKQCMPCRGTGKVTSAKGGEQRQVSCPWCEGSGQMIPEHDAQAAHAQGQPRA